MCDVHVYLIVVVVVVVCDIDVIFVGGGEFVLFGYVGEE